MSVVTKLLTMGLVGVALVAGPARAASAGQEMSAKVDDGAIKSHIVASLTKDKTIVAHDVDVDVSAGVVTLKGVVRTSDEKARAERLATVKGVTMVHNEIVVDPAKPKSTADKAVDATKHAGEKTKEVSKDVAEATKDAAVATGKKTKEIASATGEAVTDGWITTRLKSKFVDEKLLKDSDINVDTNDHVVTLKGTVMSTAGKTRAEAIASGTEGVKRVVNELIVKGMN